MGKSVIGKTAVNGSHDQMREVGSKFLQEDFLEYLASPDADNASKKISIDKKGLFGGTTTEEYTCSKDADTYIISKLDKSNSGQHQKFSVKFENGVAQMPSIGSTSMESVYAISKGFLDKYSEEFNDRDADILRDSDVLRDSDIFRDSDDVPRDSNDVLHDSDDVLHDSDVEKLTENFQTIAEKSQVAIKFNPTQAKKAFASIKDFLLDDDMADEIKIAKIAEIQNGVNDTTAQTFANVAKGILGLKDEQATSQEKTDTIEELLGEFSFIEDLGDDENDLVEKEQCSLNMVNAVSAMQVKKGSDGKPIEPAVLRDDINPHIAESIKTSFKETVDAAIAVEDQAAKAAEEEKNKSKVRTSEDYKDADYAPIIKCGKAAVALGLALGVPGVGVILAIGFLIATRNMGNGSQAEEEEEKKANLPDLDLLEYGEEFLKDFLESGEGIEAANHEIKKGAKINPSLNNATKSSVNNSKTPTTPTKSSPQKAAKFINAIDEDDFSFGSLFDEEDVTIVKKVSDNDVILDTDIEDKDVDDKENEVIDDSNKSLDEMTFTNTNTNTNTFVEPVNLVPPTIISSSVDVLNTNLVNEDNKLNIENVKIEVLNTNSSMVLDELTDKNNNSKIDTSTVILSNPTQDVVSLDNIVLNLTSRSHVDIEAMDKSSSEFIGLTTGTLTHVGNEAWQAENNEKRELLHIDQGLISIDSALGRMIQVSNLENQNQVNDITEDQIKESHITTTILNPEDLKLLEASAKEQMQFTKNPLIAVNSNVNQINLDTNGVVVDEVSNTNTENTAILSNSDINIEMNSDDSSLSNVPLDNIEAVEVVVKNDVTQESTHDNNVLSSTNKGLKRITGEIVVDHPLKDTDEIYQAQQLKLEQEARAQQLQKDQDHQLKVKQEQELVLPDDAELSDEEERLLLSVNALRANELNNDDEYKRAAAINIQNMVMAEQDITNDAMDVEINSSANDVTKNQSTSKKVWNYLFNRKSAPVQEGVDIEMNTFTQPLVSVDTTPLIKEDVNLVNDDTTVISVNKTQDEYKELVNSTNDEEVWVNVPLDDNIQLNNQLNTNEVSTSKSSLVSSFANSISNTISNVIGTKNEDVELKKDDELVTQEEHQVENQSLLNPQNTKNNLDLGVANNSNIPQNNTSLMTELEFKPDDWRDDDITNLPDEESEVISKELQKQFTQLVESVNTTLPPINTEKNQEENQPLVLENFNVNQINLDTNGEIVDEDDEKWDEPEESKELRKRVLDSKNSPTKTLAEMSRLRDDKYHAQHPDEDDEIWDEPEESRKMRERGMNRATKTTFQNTELIDLEDISEELSEEAIIQQNRENVITELKTKNALQSQNRSQSPDTTAIDDDALDAVIEAFNNNKVNFTELQKDDTIQSTHSADPNAVQKNNNQLT